MVSILSDEWIYIHKANKPWIRRFLITKKFSCTTRLRVKKNKKYCSLQNLLRSGTCPEIQSFLHVKEPSRKAWKKVYFFLRRSGLYCSTKGSSKVRESGQQVWDAQNGPTARSLKCVCVCLSVWATRSLVTCSMWPTWRIWTCTLWWTAANSTELLQTSPSVSRWPLPEHTQQKSVCVCVHSFHYWVNIVPLLSSFWCDSSFCTSSVDLCPCSPRWSFTVRCDGVIPVFPHF